MPPQIIDMHHVDFKRGKHVRIDRKSKWGNPFKLEDPDDENARLEVLWKYTLYLLRNEKLLNDVPLLEGKTLACWCFEGDTLITTDKGLVPIKNIQQGDCVLTHTLNYKLVEKVGKFDNINVLKLSVRGAEPTICTEDHPIYIRKKVRKVIGEGENKTRNLVMTEPEWIKACELKPSEYTSTNYGMYVGYPLDAASIDNDEHSLDFWYIIGRWIGDGWDASYNGKSSFIKKDGTQSSHFNYITAICSSHEEADILEDKIKQAGFHATRSERKTETTFRIAHKEFTQYLSAFGKYSYGKFIPGFCFSLSIKKQEALLHGIIDSDGSINSKTNVVEIGVSNKTLAYGIARLARNVYRKNISIKKSDVPDTLYENRIIKSNNQQHTVRISFSKKSSTIEEYGCLWMPVQKIETLNEKTTVYNISVEKDHSFVANGFIVHNCYPKQKCHGEILWYLAENQDLIARAGRACTDKEAIAEMIFAGLGWKHKKSHVQTTLF